MKGRDLRGKAGGAAALRCALALGLLSALPRAAAARVDVPVRQTVMADGIIRYSVPVTVGDGAPIEAEIDTGSFGLRVLAAALSPGQYEATGERRRYGFGSGARFDGVLARATVGVGGARTDRPVPFQRVDEVGCTERRPDCPVSRVGAADFRIASDGVPGQGFSAILGLSMERGRDGRENAANPLTAMAGRSWILVLPRPGSAEAGHLIVDPDAGDRAGFALVRLDPQPGAADEDPPGWDDKGLPGCLDGGPGRDRVCGPTVLDTGAWGFFVASGDGDRPEPWGGGRPSVFAIGGADGPVRVPFTTGHGPATGVKVHPPRARGPRINTGALPFFDYAVLYDAAAGTVGFKKRTGP